MYPGTCKHCRPIFRSMYYCWSQIFIPVLGIDMSALDGSLCLDRFSNYKTPLIVSRGLI